MRFLSSDARSGRARVVIWLGAAIAAAGLGIVVMRDGPARALPLVGSLLGLLFGKLVIEAVRRRHDAGREATGLAVLLTVAVAALVACVVAALILGIATALYAASALFVLLILVTLLAAGEATDNRWGPPPPDPWRPASGEGTGGQGMPLATALMLLGGAAGYAGMQWVAGLGDARERMQRAAERPAVTDAGDGPPLENLETAYELQQPRKGVR